MHDMSADFCNYMKYVTNKISIKHHKIELHSFIIKNENRGVAYLLTIKISITVFMLASAVIIC